jgi:hypothetical protein
MAGGAVRGRAFENIIDMAALTQNRRVLPVELEGKFGMIHRGGLPACRVMTRAALVAELTCMRIIREMT